MRKLLVVLTLTSLFALLIAGAAFAYDPTAKGDRTADFPAEDCKECHEVVSDNPGTGPHGGYATGTDKCSTCHDVHADAQNAQLLMGQTLTDACNYCHDLTGSWAGPYNMTGDFTAAAAHRVVNLRMNSFTDTLGDDNSWLLQGVVEIPGGNETDGSAGVLNTSNQGKLSGNVFTCNSCHTPHGVNVVDSYLGESAVKVKTIGIDGVDFKLQLTNRLLKTKPNAVQADVTEYGAAWCASCHKGRDNRIQVNHNHPVDETAPAYRFLELAKANGVFNAVYTIEDVVADGFVTVGTNGELNADPRTNQQYAMNAVDELQEFVDSVTGEVYYFDRITDADGFDAISNYAGAGPSCQQCHASAREVEGKFADNGKPARGNFPHISNNKGLLIEVKDDFCTNCHAPSVLP